MISGRSSDNVYAPGDARTPGHSSSVTQAPPTMSRRSKHSTVSPARARYAAATRPLWPAPMTATSSTRPRLLLLRHAQVQRERVPEHDEDDGDADREPHDDRAAVQDVGDQPHHAHHREQEEEEA